jgi:uncharacterized SAM-binding protein YcdF (DUF218 family)
VFFYASKVLFFLVQPSMICLALIGAGLALRRQRLAVAGFVSLLVVGFSPLGNLMILPLESRFQQPVLAQLDQAKISGIIILGGFEDPYVGQSRSQLTLNEAAERLTEGLLLARALPRTRVVFSGGSASLIEAVPSAANQIGQFLGAAGVAPERIVLEAVSRNTRENAVMTYDLLQPKPGERWLLVTSAFHMPRSMGIFRKAGLDVIAWPVDFRTAGLADARNPMARLDEGLRRVDLVAKELIGLIVYWLRGWTDALYPGPA